MQPRRLTFATLAALLLLRCSAVDIVTRGLKVCVRFGATTSRQRDPSVWVVSRPLTRGASASSTFRACGLGTAAVAQGDGQPAPTGPAATNPAAEAATAAQPAPTAVSATHTAVAAYSVPEPSASAAQPSAARAPAAQPSAAVAASAGHAPTKHEAAADL